MPVEVQWTAEGLFAWIVSHPESVRADLVRRIYRKAQRQALSEWATRRGRESLGFRGSEAAPAVLGLAARSPSYERRVRRQFGGRYLPYRSPSKRGTGGAGHLMDLVRESGTGHRVTARNATATVTTVLSLPAARALNFHPQYRREFLDFAGRGRQDAGWIEARVNELAFAGLKREVERAQRRAVRVKGAAA